MSAIYLKEAVPAAQVAKDLAAVRETVSGVTADIREHGDASVREYSARFDRWSPADFRLPAGQTEDIIAGLPGQVITDIEFAQRQVRTFAEAQLASMQEIEVETLPGVFLGHKHLPVESAGAYVPGGRYPLTASAHMTILTAQEVRDDASSALLGEVCGRAARVELFEGHARSGDLRAAKVGQTRPAWLAAALDHR
jgi:sulfopropanediol 3-dehydrogenase